MVYFELKEEYMQKAITYMPLAQKVILAELIARKCLKPIKPLNKKDSVDGLLIVPTVFGEDNYQKECMLLNTLLSHYFDIKIEKMDSKIYDKYMGSHILNQLERYKANPTYKEKAFDIITDFKIIKEMVRTELCNIKAKENDLLERFMKGMSIFSAERMAKKPEYLTKITGELQKFVETAKLQATISETETVDEE